MLSKIGKHIKTNIASYLQYLESDRADHIKEQISGPKRRKRE